MRTMCKCVCYRHIYSGFLDASQHLSAHTRGHIGRGGLVSQEEQNSKSNAIQHTGTAVSSSY